MGVAKLLWALPGVLIGVLCGVHNASAQQKPAPAEVKLTKEDSIALKTFNVRFGPYKMDMKPFADDVKKLAATELIVTDKQGLKWTVVSFRFGWRRRDINDDARTGKRKVIYVFNATDVTGSRLPEPWQKELAEFVLPTEELLFENIIVQHPQTKKMMRAATLTLKVI
jgi:hypothetical protein